MKKKTIAWPDVVSKNPDAVMFVDEEFMELMGDEDPEEIAETIRLESLEQQWIEETENSLRFPNEYDPDLELKGLKEREWEKKMGLCG